MMGHSHAASGFAVGALTLPLVPAGTPVEQIAWVAAVGGASMLPDLDAGGITMRSMLPRLHGSNVALTWGPVTCIAAKAVARIAGGHRNGTHSVLGVALVALFAVLASLTFPTSLLLMALMIGVSLKSLAFAIPGRIEETWVLNLALSFAAAWWLLTAGDGSPAWLPVAVALGCVVHIAGDMLTIGGCPLLYPFSKDRTALGLFKTGAAVERYAVAPLFLLAAGFLVWQQIGTIPDPAAWAAHLERTLA